MSNAAPTTEIKLIRPIEHHGQTINSITLKEPTGGLYAKLGNPRLIVYNKDGSGYHVERDDAIEKYLDASIDHQDGSILLRLMSLADVMRVKAALLDFFTDAATAATSSV